jgi:GH15 family glucan-1,4-alpha-glucosidase
MKKSEKLAACVLFLLPVLLLLVPASLFGQSPFDGTWRTNMEQAKFSPKPIVFSLNNGVYDCSSCSPKIHVKADGQDQSVTGQAYDTISVREVDAKSIELTTKKNGKTVSEQTRTVSDDGNTLTVKTTFHPENSDQTVTPEVTAARVGKAPAGANGTSGSWRTSKVKESENGLTTTYKLSGDELSMSTPTGESYTAKLDGKDYPYKGVYAYDSVSLKRVSERTIEETDKRGGKIIEVLKISVAPDGKKMTVVVTSRLTGRVSTYVAEKQ